MKIRQDIIQHIFRNKYVYSSGVGTTYSSDGSGTDERIDRWFYEDENGNLHSKLNFASDLGLTAYAQGEQDIATIMDGVICDETTITKENGKLKVIGDISGGTSNWDDLEGIPSWITDSKPTYSWSEIISKPTTFTPSSHTHNISNITDLQDELDGKANSSHTHSISNITDLQTTLDGKANKIHTHSISDITNLQTTLDGKANKSYVDDNFITISTEQNVSGIKHFINGYTVGSSNHKVYEDNGVVYIDGDVAITGGITVYAHGERSVSTIMDGVAVDGITISKENGVLKVIGDISGGTSNWNELEGIPSWITDSKPTYSWGEITSKPSTFTPSSHTHSISNITDLQDELDGKANSSHTHSWSEITSKPSTFTPSSHNHSWSNITSGIPATATRWPTISEVTNKESIIIKLNSGTTENTNQFTYNATTAKSINITPSSIGAASSSHNHSWSNITSGIPATATRWPSWSEVTSKPSTFTPSSHTHSISNISNLQSSLDSKLNSSSYTASDVLTKIKSVDGSGSLLDADLLDGKHYSDIVNGNVTSATKLQTTRTIWGQSFNGTANVSGNMTGVGSITASGNIVTQGGITCYSSDIRTKDIIEDINISLSDIASSQTIRYKWNNWKIEDDGKTHIGGIAQEIQKILPEAIVEVNDILNVDYSTTAYIYAVQIAKYLQLANKKIEELENKITELEKYISDEKTNTMVD